MLAGTSSAKQSVQNVSSIFKDFKKNRKNSLDTVYCIEKSIFYLPDDLELEEWRSVLF